VAADAWSALAAALAAERAGSPRVAERVSAFFARAENVRWIPRALRATGLEAFAWSAASRGDWPGLAVRARLGRGRSAFFLRRLARAHLQGDVWPSTLWLLWLLAPERRSGLRFVRAALRPPAPPPRVVAPSGPWGLHLRLLAELAGGRRPAMTEVARSTRAWEPVLDHAAEARFVARGLELGLLEPRSAWRPVREAVVGELETLAAFAEGSLSELGPSGLGEEVGERVQERLFTELDRILEGFTEGHRSEPRPPLDEWHAWLELHDVVERLEAVTGAEGLRAAWYSGLGQVAWNWPCQLFNTHGARTAWAARGMFAWAAATAEKVGDGEAAETNHKNEKVAAAAVA
jgi:hypothetical protein